MRPMLDKVLCFELNVYKKNCHDIIHFMKLHTFYKFMELGEIAIISKKTNLLGNHY